MAGKGQDESNSHGDGDPDHWENDHGDLNAEVPQLDQNSLAAPMPPPVVRVAQLRSTLRDAGVLDAIAEGLKTVDPKTGKVKNVIRVLKNFYGASTDTNDYEQLILELHRKVLEGKQQNRTFLQEKKELERKVERFLRNDEAKKSNRQIFHSEGVTLQAPPSPERYKNRKWL